MPELVIPEGYGEAKIIFSCTARANPVTTTLGYRTIAGGGPSTIADQISEAITVTGGPTVAAHMAHSWTYEGVEVKQNVGGTLVGGASSTPAVTGSSTGIDPPSLNCSLLIQKRTILIGRHYRGRFYWPMYNVTESAVDQGGVIESTEHDIVAGYFTLMFSALFDMEDAFPAILHDGSTPGTDISLFSLNNKIATQRRRMR